MKRPVAALLVVMACGWAASRALAQTPPKPLPVLVYGPKELQGICKDSLNLVADAGTPSKQAAEVVKPFTLESYNPLSQVVKPGWYRLTVRVRRGPEEPGSLHFSLWNPPSSPGHFRYQAEFSPQEYPAPGQWGDLTRTLQVGPMNEQYGLQLVGGWPGLRIDSLKLEGVRVDLRLLSIRPNKLLYKLGEQGTVAVTLQNASDAAQVARLTVEVLSGLDQRNKIYDKDLTVPLSKGGSPFTVSVPLPAQEEYGHAVVATLHRQERMFGTAREYFYTTDHPVRIGHLGAMGIAEAYTAEQAAPFVEQMRRHYFPMYEIIFWAPDDATMLTPPPGKDRWWSGQTLGRAGTESMIQRVRLGHEQGMKVLAYTDLRYDYGFRIAEYFRRHPEACDWDANNPDLAYGVSSLRRQNREDDKERFDDKNQPRFNAEGIWGLMTGNPDVVDRHAQQLVAATKLFDFDGWRYDDRYDYDSSGVDILGRETPWPGWTNPAILAKLRRELEKTKPGIIYGHNMEWSQSLRTDGPPMPLDARPFAGDYYTEFVRDDGLHLQERWTAYMVGDHARWQDVAENLFRVGFNAYRWGGHAYDISAIQNARPVDGRYLTALHLAGYSHIAYDVSDEEAGYMRLACRHADLLFGEDLVPVLDPEKLLAVDAGKRELWWKRYVRFRQTAPGRRVYLVHLINPPVAQKIGEGPGAAPEPVSRLQLHWSLPDGWKCLKAWHLAGEGGAEVVNIGGVDRVGYDVIQQPLEVREKPPLTDVTLPRLGIWSIVVLDCEGPKDDLPPRVKMELPPAPEAPAPKEPAVVQGDHSPNGLRPLVYDSSAPWGDANHKPFPKVTDAEAERGQAVRCTGPILFEGYSSGEAILGGLYRVSLRLKSAVAPPKDAKLEFNAWCPADKPNPWRVHQVIPLSDLAPGRGWQTIRREVEMGYGWNNFGVQVLGGFDGLLLDRLVVEEVRRAPEAKQMQLRGLKGWPAEQRLVKHDGLRVWYGEGLYYEYYRLVEALKTIPGATVVESAHYVWRNQRGFDGPGWKSPEDLASYDLVVLNNIDLRTLGLEQRDWLRGYVQAGGSLWLIGGPYGFGRGYWHESDLLEPVLPVRMHAYDLRPDGRDAPLVLKPAKDGMFAGEPWAENPRTVWLHEVELKPGATAQVTAGEHPALATWQSGNGRVAVLMVTPLGDEPPGTPVWWTWKGWEPVMQRTAKWLLRR